MSPNKTSNEEEIPVDKKTVEVIWSRKNLDGDDALWLVQLTKLINFSKEKFNLVIDYDSETNTSTAYSDGKIVLASKLVPRKLFYHLLHELGHIVLWKKSWYKEKYGKKKNYGSNAYKLRIVEEEIDAWNIGEQIAIREGYELDEWFDVVRAQAIMSYVKHIRFITGAFEKKIPDQLYDHGVVPGTTSKKSLKLDTTRESIACGIVDKNACNVFICEEEGYDANYYKEKEEMKEEENE